MAGDRQVFNRYDGHIWYVIGTDGQRRAVIGIVFVEKYDELSEHRGQPGLFFVRDAACDPSGQHGDPTVHEGWAMYTWDAYFRDHNGGWRKVAEQESVDGPWGIDERILKMLVKKTEYNAKMEEIDGKLSDFESRIKDIETQINGLIEDLDELKKFKHWHENKDILDAINTAKNGQLMFRGSPVGNCFLYDNIVDGKIYWEDPTGTTTSQEIDASYRLAELFCQTPLAYAGMVLMVAEADGSISQYQIVQDETTEGPLHPIEYIEQIRSNRRYRKLITEEKTKTWVEITAAEAKDLFENPIAGTEIFFYEHGLSAVCINAAVKDAFGGICYVETLPVDNVSFDGRGLWCPLRDDGIHTPFKIYQSKYGTWVEVEKEYGSSVELPFSAAEFTLTFCEDDPIMPRKLIHLKWKEPEDRTYLDKPVRWGKSYLVKKANSIPTSVNDGTLVRVITDHNVGLNGIVDVNWFHDGPTFYRLFSETVGGSKYIPNEGVEPKYMEWENIISLCDQGRIAELVSEGDVFVLPPHPVFGQITCDVISVLNNSIKVVTRDALEVMRFGDTNDYDISDLKSWVEAHFTDFTCYDVSKVSRAQSGVAYYIYNKGYKPLTIEVGESFPEGIEVYEKTSAGVLQKFEVPDPFSSEYDFEKINKETHFNHKSAPVDWWTNRSLMDNLVITGNNPNGTVATSELGVRLVFTIGRP